MSFFSAFLTFMNLFLIISLAEMVRRLYKEVSGLKRLLHKHLSLHSAIVFPN